MANADKNTSWIYFASMMSYKSFVYLRFEDCPPIRYIVIIQCILVIFSCITIILMLMMMIIIMIIISY